MYPESADCEIPSEVTSVAIPGQRIFDGRPFPLVLSPSPSHSSENASYWVNWIDANVNQLKHLLLKHGTILFCDFPIEEPKDFDDLSAAFGYPPFPFVGGVGVRRTIVGNVLTSTEAPPEEKIMFHHEMAHVLQYPKILFFYCDLPALEGGTTPILLSHKLHELMERREPEFTARLEREGLRYVRVAPLETDFTSGIGRSWRSTFFTDSPEEAEIRAKEAGFDVEWLENQSLRTTTGVLPAVMRNKKTGKKLWFNTALATRSWQDKHNDCTKACVFPNGDLLPSTAIDTLEQSSRELGVAFQWSKCDMLLVDNMQVMHSRGPFTPPRRILVSLYKDQDYDEDYDHDHD